MVEEKKTLWQKADGKKTGSGLLLLAAGALAKAYGYGEEFEQLKPVIEALIASGALTTVVGVVHKIIKSRK